MEEDQARITLEHPVAALRQAQAVVERAVSAEQNARLQRNSALNGTGVGSQSWIASESEAQINRVLAVRAALVVPKLEQEIGAKREAYFDRRLERRKAETLLERAVGKENREYERRSRAEIEDLLQARRRYEWLRSKEG